MRYVSDESQESSDDGDSSEDERESGDGSQLSGAEEGPGGAGRGGKSEPVPVGDVRGEHWLTVLSNRFRTR